LPYLRRTNVAIEKQLLQHIVSARVLFSQEV
jgi:hypothetical protein